MGAALLCTVDALGTALYVMGRNDQGQLGLGDNVARNVPTQVAAPNGAATTLLAMGGTYSAFVAGADAVGRRSGTGALAGHGEGGSPQFRSLPGIEIDRRMNSDVTQQSTKGYASSKVCKIAEVACSLMCGSPLGRHITLAYCCCINAGYPPPPLAHARPCLSTRWALNRRFEEILGLFLWSRMEDWVSVERLYRERGAHSCL